MLSNLAVQQVNSVVLVFIDKELACGSVGGARNKYTSF